jgi:hypothetical protein
MIPSFLSVFEIKIHTILIGNASQPSFKLTSLLKSFP